ncbi:MAG: ribosome-binding factor A, partial [Paracoccaceae bacterium]
PPSPPAPPPPPPDLRVATAYVLPLGGGDTDTIVAALERNRTKLRQIVNRAVTLKFSPELRFLPDTSFDRMDRTRQLLSDPKVRRDLDKG